ncbi:MAG: NAD(P)/FAD-dependent oxidoreductase [Actinomycetota bacterium]
MEQTEVDVLIIGGGIAGPALAAALAPHQLRVALVERDAGPLDTARGDHLQPRAVELLDAWGALDDIVGLGAEQRHGTIWYDTTGQPLVRAMLDQTDLPFPYFLYLNHELINQALLTAAGRNPNLTVYKPVTGWELIERSPTACTVEIAGEGGPQRITASVLVGADGQNSRIRQVAGIDAELSRYARPISIFFAPYTEQPEGNSLTAYIGDQGIVALVPRTGGICKIGIATNPDELSTWRELDGPGIRDRINALLSNAGGPGLPIGEPEHIGTYPPVRVTAERWVSDNIVLMGDACHAMHPAQSQGMNVAIRCADALTAALVASPDDPGAALLAYEQATRPAIEPILETNHQAGSLFDVTTPEPLQGFTDMLTGLGANEQATLGYTITTAGYPPPA